MLPMKGTRLIVRRQEPFYGHRLELYIGVLTENSYPMVVTNMTLDHEPDEGQRATPALVLDEETAQKLMDSLWDSGIRPSAGHGSAGAMAAVQKHLDDMRALVFKTVPGSNE
jgi:hypothetical protein